MCLNLDLSRSREIKENELKAKCINTVFLLFTRFITTGFKASSQSKDYGLEQWAETGKRITSVTINNPDSYLNTIKLSLVNPLPMPAVC